ncbi:MAG: 3-hydroxybutyryl-CoA dehydrogenase [Oscillospiraceae bacterium]|nr:3-hydroxybutyryl-CoA dehydrogenase [Oscillospiraceae bacterium]
MKSVFVAGAGTMGAGVAQVFAGTGCRVVLYDIQLAFAEAGVAKIGKGLEKLVEKGKMDEAQKAALLGNISASAALEDAADCDLVLEAIVEDVAIKRSFFQKLDAICKPEAIFASNTSSISITEIAAAVARQGQFVGMHFFNPAPVMKLVEVIRGAQTSDETFQRVFALSEALGKEPVEVEEAPGFVVNRILIPMINEAIGVLEQGVASAADIDKAMCLGAGHPMGPLALSDLVGNDVVLNIMNTLYTETGDSKYRASGLLKKMVRAGKLGKKTGEGFHKY